MNKISPIQLIQIILLINGIFWIGTGILSFFFSRASYTLPGFNIYLLIKLLMFGYGLVMVILSILIARKNSLVYSVTLGISILTFIFSFMDDLGLIDFMYIGFILIQTILLIKYRKVITDNSTSTNPLQ